MLRDRIGARVRRDDRRPAHPQDVPHRVMRDVGDVHQHPQPVQLADHLHAERRQPARARFVGARVRPIDRLRVRQPQVPRAPIVELAERRQRVLDHVATLDPDQPGDLSAAADPLDVVGRPGQRKGVVVAGDHPVDQVELLERHLFRGAGPRRLRGDVHHPELPIDAAAPQPWDVGLDVGLELRDVEPLEVPRGPDPHTPRQVVVPVDQQRGLVQPQRFGGDLDRPRLPGGRRRPSLVRPRRPGGQHDQDHSPDDRLPARHHLPR